MGQKHWLAHRYGPGSGPSGPAHTIGRILPFYLGGAPLLLLIALAGGWMRLRTAGDVPPPTWWMVTLTVYVTVLFLMLGLRVAYAWAGKPRIGLFEWMVLIVQAAGFGGIAHVYSLPAQITPDVSWQIIYLVAAQLMFIVSGAFVIHWLASKTGADPKGGEIPRWWIYVVLFLPPLVAPPLTVGLFLLLIVGPFIGPLLVLVALVIWMTVANFQRNSARKPRPSRKARG